MLRIRLARGGSTHRPCYRLVVARAQSPRDGRFVEQLGVYHPLLADEHTGRVRFDVERAKHWLGVGAQVSDRVRRFFVQEGLLEQLPRPPQTKKNKPKAKALERLKKASSSAAASS